MCIDDGKSLLFAMRTDGIGDPSSAFTMYDVRKEQDAMVVQETRGMTSKRGVNKISYRDNNINMWKY